MSCTDGLNQPAVPARRRRSLCGWPGTFAARRRRRGLAGGRDRRRGATKIAVVICSYSPLRWPALVEAVESLRTQVQAPSEIVVVVDHNPDLLERASRELPDVIVVPNPNERGLSGARNAGVAVARGEVIAFIDDDAVADPEWTLGLAAGYAHHESVIGVGGPIEPLWSAPPPQWFPDEFHWVVGCSYRGLPESRSPVRNLIGANMSFRREVFERVGQFRTGVGRVGTLPFGCEETEFCIRAGRERPGGTILFEPRARVRHRVDASRTSWRYFLARCYAEGHSKALVSELVGSSDALASERAYASRVLPLGVRRGVSDAFLRRDANGLGRSGAILLGLGVTAAGYARGRAARRGRAPLGAVEWRPTGAP